MEVMMDGGRGGGEEREIDRSCVWAGWLGRVAGQGGWAGWLGRVAGTMCGDRACYFSPDKLLIFKFVIMLVLLRLKKRVIKWFLAVVHVRPVVRCMFTSCP